MGEEGVIGVHGVIYRDKRRGISGVHAVPRLYCGRGRTEECEIIGLLKPRSADNRVRPQPHQPRWAGRLPSQAYGFLDSHREMKRWPRFHQQEPLGL